MKPYEIIKDIFIVGGPEITDSRDGCVYLINLGELVLIDSGAGWSADKIINNVKKLGFDPKNLERSFSPIAISTISGAPRKSGRGMGVKFVSTNWMPLRWKMEIRS